MDLIKSNKYRISRSLNELTSEGDEYIDLIPSNEAGFEEKSNHEVMIMEYISNHFKKQDRDIFLSYFYDGKTYKETGSKYGVSADTIRRKINEMLEEIRRWWK